MPSPSSMSRSSHAVNVPQGAGGAQTAKGLAEDASSESPNPAAGRASQPIGTPSGHSQGARAGRPGSDVDLAATRESEVRHLTPAVLLLLRGLLLLEDREVFRGEARWVYEGVSDMVVVRSLEVRAAVRELLSVRLRSLLSLPGEDG